MTNNQITYRKPRGISRQGMRILGLLLLLAGAAGKAILQDNILHMSSMMDLEQMTVLIETYPWYTLGAILLKVVSCCALPIFSFMLVEGLQNTSSVKFYLLRMLGTAALCEVPYDLIMYGKIFDWYNLNPVFTMVLALVMLYLLRYYSGKELKNILASGLIVIMALVWSLLVIPGGKSAFLEDGPPIILVTATMWLARKKKGWQIFGGSVVIILIALVVPGMRYITYMGAPVSFLALHFYNEEEGDGNRLLNYLAYPAILLALALIGRFAF